MAGDDVGALGPAPGTCSWDVQCEPSGVHVCVCWEAREWDWEKHNVERVSTRPLTDYNHKSIDKSIRTRNT